MIDRGLIIDNLGKDVTFYSINDNSITKRSFKDYHSYTITKSTEHINGSGVMILELKNIFMYLNEAIKLFED